MIREQKPAGPRRDFSPSKTQENQKPGASRYRPSRESIVKATRGNDQPSLFTFGDFNHVDDSTNESLEFLPSPSFDDLQSSIASASSEFKFDRIETQPLMNGTNGTRRSEVTERPVIEALTHPARSLASTSDANSSRPTRAGSVLRRQNTATRQSSVSSTASATITGNMDPPSAPLASRTRRQSQYPPVSGSAAANAANLAKVPRKSIGPGVIDSDHTRMTRRRRPSLATNVQELEEAASILTNINPGVKSLYTDSARSLTVSRATKTKSLQPPSRNCQSHLTALMGTPEQNRLIAHTAKSPIRANGRGTATPSSSHKRLSVMPGMPSQSHATGLGARTVSPTDARRAKRQSMRQGPPTALQLSMPQPDAVTDRTSSAASPSTQPPKAPTPPSSRTTPDANWKLYSSGPSTASSTSFSTSRASTGSLQPRLSQLPSSSRLPTPKPRNVHSSPGNEEEKEYVPPVPAIPKAYESPKESPAEPPAFARRKSSLQFDSSSTNSSSTNSLSRKSSAREIQKSERELKPFSVGLFEPSQSDLDINATPIKRKNLQPLRLPPFNLLPLNTSAIEKVEGLQEPTVLHDFNTPPPKRNNPTPSTPMTASKASLFPRKPTDSGNSVKSPSHMRSCSAKPFIRSSSTASNLEASRPVTINRQQRQAVSPFISLSLPKNDGEPSCMPRSKTSGDFLTLETPLEPQRPPRLTGPRAPKVIKKVPATNEKPSHLSSPEDPPTPSSGSSLRRKLSMSWKRGTSRSNISLSHAANERDSEYQAPRHDNMPPPRLPASATVKNLNSSTVPSPSPSVKSTTFLDSKRRKSSASSLSLFGGHDRTRSDSWGFQASTIKDSSSKFDGSASTSRSSTSVMHKMLNSKGSTSAVRLVDHWTEHLDKDDLSAEEEIQKLASKRKETEQAARQLDALRKRATPKERFSPQEAIRYANLNIFERGEIVDYKDVYFCGTANAPKHVGELSADTVNFGYDDERGDYSIVQGDHLSYRYEVVDLLGKGSFGQVVRCVDHKTGGLVAVKIIRNKRRFHQQALVEVNILQKLREWDPKNKFSMVNFTQSFYFRGHLCISTELLDMNLYEFIKSNSFRGFSLKIVRRFTKQILNSLLLLKQHKVIHCDLKPENVLLAHPLHSEIKVIDFGSSCFENEKVYTYIQSRFYRSPEVILGMTYGMPIDMWSLGCILAELYSGVPIFPGENEQEQLACIMEIFGPPEKHLIEKASRRKLFFDSLGKPRLTVSPKGRRRRPSSKTLQQVLKCDDEPFLDFLARCLRWDPDRRLKPDEAVRHEFITGQKMPPPSSTTRGTSSRPFHTSSNDSPVKRNNTIATPAGNRPLPEPPATSFKNGMAVRSRQVSASGGSPTKYSSGPSVHRRQSVAKGNGGISCSGSTSSLASNKRVSTVAPGNPTTTSNGISSLPRVTRNASGNTHSTIATVSTNGGAAIMSRRA